MKVLVCGWFSFEQMGATAGDLLCQDVVCERLRQLGVSHDVAVIRALGTGVDWQSVDPSAYTHLFFVCGPAGNGYPLTDLFARFAHCRLVGLNLSMLQRLEEWNPFQCLIERDSSRRVTPDLAFTSRLLNVPVAGVVLVHPQKEYGNRARHTEANQLLQNLLMTKGAAPVSVDTRLDIPNPGGLRSAEAVASVLGKMDVVLTTRLHGLVLALKQGVPAIAVDAIAGGAKLTYQAKAIGWPYCFAVDAVQPGELEKAFEACLSPEGRKRARDCAGHAAEKILLAYQEFDAWLGQEKRESE